MNIQDEGERQVSSSSTVCSILWGRDRVAGIATRYGWTAQHSIPDGSNFSSSKPVQNGHGVHPAFYNGYHGSSGRKAAEAWC
jgi:hypothetical protein